MKIIIYILFSVIISFSLNLAPIAQIIPEKENLPPNGYKLVWSDEFDYNGLPNPEKWAFESGYKRNKEVQCYIENNLENVKIFNNQLHLSAHHYPVESWPYRDICQNEPEHVKNISERYSSGSITTRGIKSWKYGYFEIKVKLPTIDGVWPAFWTLGKNIEKVNWPKSGEIDIFEFIGRYPDKYFHGIHFLDKKTKKKSNIGPNIIFFDSEIFNIFAIEWKENKIRYFLNGTLINEINLNTNKIANRAFNKPHFLILNLALGGDWAGDVNNNELPAHMIIDYIRIYQHKED